jgi:pyridine nucleotide-disulfide oxidoreductase family protein
MKRLLLIGGGHAHVHVLRALARQPLAAVEINLVSPFARQMYAGMVPGMVAGHYPEEACVIPLLSLARAAGACFIQGSVAAVDAARRTVTLADGQQLHYEALSLDTGPVMDRDLIPGARHHALFIRPIEHFTRLWERVLALAESRPLGVVVIGGGAAGVELCLAIQHRLTGRARVSLVTGGGPPMTGHAPGVQARVLAVLRRYKISVVQDSCTEVTSTHVMLGGGGRLICDAPVMALGDGCPRWLAGSGLALDEQGFVCTGPTLQSLSHPDVFAAGDVAVRPDAPRARDAVLAEHAGPPLARNLRRWLAGGDPRPCRPRRRALTLLSCGEKSAIAAWGPWWIDGRWVWWWKDRVDRRFVSRYSLPSVPAEGQAA